MQGKILWFDRKKGYGFIASETGDDVFVHHSGICKDGPRAFYEGDEVSFEIVEGEKGPKADHVQLIQKSNA